MHRPLTLEDLLPHGPLARIGRAIHLLDTAASTNELLLRHAGAVDGAIATAEFQTAGRGRQGRRWEAPRGSSILLSVLLIEPADSPLIIHAAQLAGLAT